MATVLDRIVEQTRIDLARRRRSVPVSDLEGHPLCARKTVRLEDALRADGIAVIAEIKRRSPSASTIRSAVDVASLAAGYQAAGAAAVSVLTETPHFGGSLQDLIVARQAVSIPVLRKDFVVDTYQLYEARAYGADAVLLIATVLSRTEMDELLHAAELLDLSCLVEVYSKNDLEKIDLSRINILGVNNRNLHTFEVNIDNCLNIFGSITESVIRVAESGISEPAQLARLGAAGIEAALVGESLMRSDDPANALRVLLAGARESWTES